MPTYHIETVYYVTSDSGHYVAKCYSMEDAQQVIDAINRVATNDNNKKLLTSDTTTF